MRALLVVCVALALILPGCLARKTSESVSELGVVSKFERRTAQEGSYFEMGFPVVQRNRKPAVSTWAGAAGEMFRMVPDTVKSVTDPTLEVLSAATAPVFWLISFGTAGDVMQKLIPDYSATQNGLVRGDGQLYLWRADEVTQEERADGTIVVHLRGVELRAQAEPTPIPVPILLMSGVSPTPTTP
jgi:hypothetical protein